MPALRFRDHPRHLRRLLEAALEAADPYRAVCRSLNVHGRQLQLAERSWDLPPEGRLILIAFGKASLAMAQAAHDVLGSRIDAGLVIAPHGIPARLRPPLRLLRAGHPLPTEGSLRAGRAVSDLLRATTRADRILVLISGGGSALLELPLPGIGLPALRSVNRMLLASGAPIEDINTVRKALSCIKSGGLVRLAAPARLAALVLSDVVGDPLTMIASGPTVLRTPNTQRAAQALKRYSIWQTIPEDIRRALSAARAKPNPAPRPLNLIVGSNRIALQAVAETAAGLGFQVRVVTSRLRGEARIAGERLARRLQRLPPEARPACLLMGGETTVHVTGRGRGGRNQELALAAARILDGTPNIAVMSFATDGVDGPTDAAGARITGQTAAAMRAQGFDPHRALQENDAYPALEAAQALIRTGPTGTNVNDLAVGLAYV